MLVSQLNVIAIDIRLIDETSANGTNYYEIEKWE